MKKMNLLTALTMTGLLMSNVSFAKDTTKDTTFKKMPLTSSFLNCLNGKIFVYNTSYHNRGPNDSTFNDRDLQDIYDKEGKYFSKYFKGKLHPMDETNHFVPKRKALFAGLPVIKYTMYHTELGGQTGYVQIDLRANKTKVMKSIISRFGNHPLQKIPATEYKTVSSGYSKSIKEDSEHYYHNVEIRRLGKNKTSVTCNVFPNYDIEQ